MFHVKHKSYSFGEWDFLFRTYFDFVQIEYKLFIFECNYQINNQLKIFQDEKKKRIFSNINFVQQFCDGAGIEN